MMFTNPKENIFRAGIIEGMHVGDFGVGSGAYTTELASVVRNHGRVYAVDIQAPLLRRLEGECSSVGVNNVKYLHGDLEIPYGSKIGDAVLDFCVLSNVLFQVKRKQAVLTELKRTLRSGGRFLLIDWENAPGQHHSELLHPDDAKLLCELIGFRYVKPVSAGPYLYGMIFEKT